MNSNISPLFNLTSNFSDLKFNSNAPLTLQDPGLFQNNHFSSGLPLNQLMYNYNKLANLHPNPCVQDSNDDLYLTAKKVKSNATSISSTRGANEEERTRENSPLTHNDNLLSPESSKMGHVLENQSQLDTQILNYLLLQNVHQNTLRELEILSRFNELQELAKIQNIQSEGQRPTYGSDFNNLFLLSLFSGQPQAYQNLPYLNQSQNVSDKTLINDEISRSSQLNQIKKRNNEVILIEDEEINNEINDTNPLVENISTSVVSNMFDQEASSSPSTSEISERKNLQEENEPVNLNAIKQRKPKKNKKAVIQASIEARREKAINRWKAIREYKEQIQVELSKPYVIDLHIDPNNTEQKNQ